MRFDSGACQEEVCVNGGSRLYLDRPGPPLQGLTSVDFGFGRRLRSPPWIWTWTPTEIEHIRIAGTRHDAEINADMEAARSLGIEGTPSFLLGRTTGDTLEGVLVIGAVPFEVFDAKIKELLAPAGKPAK